jgi:hypothetical protein
MLEARLRPSGRGVYSFNRNFDASLKRARGGDLVVTCVADRLVLPEAHRHLLPIPYDAIQAKLKTTSGGIERHTAKDGTRVVLLYARDVGEMQKLVDGLELDGDGDDDDDGQP